MSGLGRREQKKSEHNCEHKICAAVVVAGFSCRRSTTRSHHHPASTLQRDLSMPRTIVNTALRLSQAAVESLILSYARFVPGTNQSPLAGRAG